MKRDCLGHTKMRKLCRRLDLPLWQAAGLLEVLWHLTAREAPQGDIGRLSDEDIAIGMDYRGDEGNLIEALVLCGWLDRHETHRLLVHDWAEHCDDAVHMRLARGKLWFADGTAPRYQRLPKHERMEAEEFYTGTPESDSVRTKPESVRTPEARRHDGGSVPRQSPAPPEPRPAPPPDPEPVRVLETAASSSNLSPTPNRTTRARRPTNGVPQRVSASEAAGLIQPEPADLEAAQRLLQQCMPPGWDLPDAQITTAILAECNGEGATGLVARLAKVIPRGRNPDIRSYGWFLSVLRGQRKEAG